MIKFAFYLNLFKEGAKMTAETDRETYLSVWIGIYANRHERQRGVDTPKSKDWQEAKIGGKGFYVIDGMVGRVVGFGLQLRADATEDEVDEIIEESEWMVEQVQTLFGEWSFDHMAEVCTAPHFFGPEDSHGI